MRRTAVAIVAALLLAGLAGCGAGSRGTTTRHFASLCVDAGLPLSGPQKAAGEGVLAGLRSQVPAAGRTVGGYRVRLCHVFDDAAGVLGNARRAAESVRTIAYVGELSTGQAGMAEAVLAQAGIALITPSGPVSAPAPTESTGLYLLPSTRTQADAVAELRATHHCAERRDRRPACNVVASTTAPLCTGIAPVPAAVRPRFCALAGPDLSDASGWTSPAVAYGDSAGRLLVATLKSIALSGEDVAERATVLRGLLRANLTSSPIGTIRFDPAGAIETNLFAAYTVRADGRLALSESIRAH